jgi:hypothetical protein
MARCALLLAATLCAVAAPAAQAATYGRVASHWTSATRRGAPRATFPPTTPAIYASFVWARPPSPGLPLLIRWYSPDGVVRSQWTSQTQAGDVAGTRLWSVLRRALYRSRSGRWHAGVLVDGRIRGYLAFTVS